MATGNHCASKDSGISDPAGVFPCIYFRNEINTQGCRLSGYLALSCSELIFFIRFYSFQTVYPPAPKASPAVVSV